jgi:hypothetical protein
MWVLKSSKAALKRVKKLKLDGKELTDKVVRNTIGYMYLEYISYKNRIYRL